MDSRFRGVWFLAVLLALPVFGCEAAAAKREVEIRIEKVGDGDIDQNAGQLIAFAALPDDSCSLGPCDPNPCPDDPLAPQKTWCIGSGTSFNCACPPGQSNDPMDMNACFVPPNCQNPGAFASGSCNRAAAGATCQQTPDMMDTMCVSCDEGYMTPETRCTTCDEANGYFDDGFGTCSQEVEVCRDGQGLEDFMAFVEKGRVELGHEPNEIELAAARMELGDGALGVRAWTYLFSGEIQLVLKTTTGAEIVAGVAQVPAESAGTQPIEFEITIDRPTFSRDPQFLEGNFSVGIRGATDRADTDDFLAEFRLLLEFHAF